MHERHSDLVAARHDDGFAFKGAARTSLRRMSAAVISSWPLRIAATASAVIRVKMLAVMPSARTSTWSNPLVPSRDGRRSGSVRSSVLTKP